MENRQWAVEQKTNMETTVLLYGVCGIVTLNLHHLTSADVFSPLFL